MQRRPRLGGQRHTATRRRSPGTSVRFSSPSFGQSPFALRHVCGFAAARYHLGGGELHRVRPHDEITNGSQERNLSCPPNCRVSAYSPPSPARLALAPHAFTGAEYRNRGARSAVAAEVQWASASCASRPSSTGMEVETIVCLAHILFLALATLSFSG